jgi:hypothetical protein
MATGERSRQGEYYCPFGTALRLRAPLSNPSPLGFDRTGTSICVVIALSALFYFTALTQDLMPVSQGLLKAWKRVATTCPGTVYKPFPRTTCRNSDEVRR